MKLIAIIAFTLATLTPFYIQAEESSQDITGLEKSAEAFTIAYNAKDASSGKITFTMEESGDFVWSFNEGKDTTELKGTLGMDDKDLLVMTSDDSQMVSVVGLDGKNTMATTGQ